MSNKTSVIVTPKAGRSLPHYLKHSNPLRIYKSSSYICDVSHIGLINLHKDDNVTFYYSSAHDRTMHKKDFPEKS